MKALDNYVIEKLSFKKGMRNTISRDELPKNITPENYKEFLLLPDLKESIKDLYHKEFPGDDFYKDIKDESVETCIKDFFENTNLWEEEYCINDSIVRERIWGILSQLCDVEYNDFYEVWINS